MKTILLILIYSFLFGQTNSKDSLVILKYDPKVGLDMKELFQQPGVMEHGRQSIEI